MCLSWHANSKWSTSSRLLQHSVFMQRAPKMRGGDEFFSQSLWLLASCSVGVSVSSLAAVLGAKTTSTCRHFAFSLFRRPPHPSYTVGMVKNRHLPGVSIRRQSPPLTATELFAPRLITRPSLRSNKLTPVAPGPPPNSPNGAMALRSDRMDAVIGLRNSICSRI